MAGFWRHRRDTPGDGRSPVPRPNVLHGVRPNVLRSGPVDAAHPPSRTATAREPRPTAARGPAQGVAVGLAISMCVVACLVAGVTAAFGDTRLDDEVWIFFGLPAGLLAGAGLLFAIHGSGWRGLRRAMWGAVAFTAPVLVVAVGGGTDAWVDLGPAVAVMLVTSAAVVGAGYLVGRGLARAGQVLRPSG